jgi:hypothetical protein
LRAFACHSARDSADRTFTPNRNGFMLGEVAITPTRALIPRSSQACEIRTESVPGWASTVLFWRKQGKYGRCLWSQRRFRVDAMDRSRLTPPLREVGGSCPRSQLSIFHCSVTGSCGSSDENCFGMIRPRGVSSSPDDTEKRNLEAASVYRASMQKRTR